MNTHDRRNRNIVSPRVLGVAVGLSLSMLTVWGVARAGTPDIGIDLSQAQPILDNQLDNMRGKGIEAFNLSLASSVQGDGVTRSAGVDIGVNLVNLKHGRPQVTSSEFTSETPSGGVSSGTQGTASGGTAPLTNVTGGVAQVVQIVGSGNSGLNDATIDITSGALAAQTPPATGGTPCTTCTVTEGKKGISVTVDAPGIGDAEQMIGTSQIAQGITLNANDAAAINSLSLQIQMAPNSNSNLAGLGSIVNSIPH